MELHALNQYSTWKGRGWSPRSFSARDIEPEKLLCLLDAARRTPSYRDEQPWGFIVAGRNQRAEFQNLVACLSQGDADWAQHAAVLMLSVVRLESESDSPQNRHAFRDVRHAVSNLVLRAATMGLVVHEMAGFNAARVREQFQIPRGCIPVGAIALGYPAVQGHQAGDTNEVRSTRPLESFVFAGRWGQPAQLFDEWGREPTAYEAGCGSQAGNGLVHAPRS